MDPTPHNALRCRTATAHVRAHTRSQAPDCVFAACSDFGTGCAACNRFVGCFEVYPGFYVPVGASLAAQISQNGDFSSVWNGQASSWSGSGSVESSVFWNSPRAERLEASKQFSQLLDTTPNKGYAIQLEAHGTGVIGVFFDNVHISNVSAFHNIWRHRWQVGYATTSSTRLTFHNYGPGVVQIDHVFVNALTAPLQAQCECALFDCSPDGCWPQCAPPRSLQTASLAAIIAP